MEDVGEYEEENTNIDFVSVLTWVLSCLIIIITINFALQKEIMEQAYTRGHAVSVNDELR